MAKQNATTRNTPQPPPHRQHGLLRLLAAQVRVLVGKSLLGHHHRHQHALVRRAVDPDLRADLRERLNVIQVRVCYGPPPPPAALMRRAIDPDLRAEGGK